MSKPAPPAPHIQAEIFARVQRVSVKGVARELDLSAATIARLAGGLPVQPATAEYAERRLRVQRKAEQV